MSELWLNFTLKFRYLSKQTLNLILQTPDNDPNGWHL